VRSSVREPVRRACDDPRRWAASTRSTLKGGTCEVGRGTLLLEEARLCAEAGFRGAQVTAALRDLAVRDHLAGIQLIGEDLPQAASRVDLDPHVRDVHGFPVSRMTHGSHRFERAAPAHFGPRLQAICRRAASTALTDAVSAAFASSGAGGGLVGPYASRRVTGTARMGEDPDRSVADRWRRLHELDNVVLADGSVFVSSGAFNPTLTIMALALRAARHVGR
jgi:choline dehydrogenase-like flavoprotein